MAVADTSKRIAEAQKLAKSEPTKAEEIYKDVLSTDPGSNDSAIKSYETALIGLGELYRDQKRVDALAELVKQARSVLSSFAKAKTSKLGELPQHHAQHMPRCLARLTPNSKAAARALHDHPQHHRHTNIRHQVVHRMGRLRAKRIFEAEPGDTARLALHGKAVLL
jgi:hypothetical protein